MPLPANVTKQFTDWAIAKKIPLTCSQCGSSEPGSVDWIAPPTMNNKQMADKLTSLPMITLFCRGCGHVRLFATGWKEQPAAVMADRFILHREASSEARKPTKIIPINRIIAAFPRP